MFKAKVSSFCLGTILFALITLVVGKNGAKKAPYCYSSLSHKESVHAVWKCRQQNGTCLRVPTVVDDDTKDCLTSLNVCNLICDPHASLWPLPTANISIQKLLTSFSGSNISFVNFSDKNQKLDSLLAGLRTYLIQVLDYLLEPSTAANTNSTGGMSIKLVLKSTETTSLTYNTSESYRLVVDKDTAQVNVVVEADNYFGARHGIETLLQLIVYDEISTSLLVPSHFSVSDTPAYKHRGILLDTSRNYYPVKVIKRLLDGMAYNKMNVFHWHMIDSQSFPFASKTNPKMTAYGAYGPTKVYTWSDITDLVLYAAVRGIKIVPEIDTPAHIGEGLQFLGRDILLKFNAHPWTKFCGEPPCAILNPINEHVYPVLAGLYSEFGQLFDSDVFHMGGDEIRFVSWNETRSVVEWLERRNMTRSYGNFMQMWATFQNRAAEELDKAVKKDEKPKIILWTSELTAYSKVKEFLDPNRYIIEVWENVQDRQIVSLLDDGYQVILSNIDVLYLNYGFGSWIGECENNCMQYASWQKIYRHDPMKIVRNLTHSQPLTRPDYESQILGSEACLWSEQSDQHTMDQRIWPRAAALAERLWSNPQTDKAEAALNRLLTQRERMAARNIAPDVLQPLWCYQNQGSCV